MKRITLLMAMEDEASSLIRELGLERAKPNWNPRLPMPLFSGSCAGAELHLVLNGRCRRFGVDSIASQPAAVAALVACEHLDPDILINAGTAGGFIARGGEIGKVYLGHDRIIFHDRRCEIPGLREYALGSYPTPDVRALAGRLGVETGVFSTGNALDAPEADLAIMREHRVVAKDMEAAAIAWVAETFGKPLIAMKSITDLVDSGIPAEGEFLRNLACARESLTAKLVELISEPIQI